MIFRFGDRRASRSGCAANEIDPSVRNVVRIARRRMASLSRMLIVAALASAMVAFSLAPPARADWGPPDEWFPVPPDFPPGLHQRGINDILGWCEEHMSMPPAAAQHYGTAQKYSYCVDFATNVLNTDASRAWQTDLNSRRQASDRWRWCMDQNHNEAYCDEWTPIR